MTDDVTLPMTLKVREIYIESITLLFCARISRSAKDERTKATASFCARTKMCRPFPLKFGGKATRSRHLCAALADAAVSLSLSLTHARSSSSYSSHSSACKTCERVANLRVFTRIQPRRERRRKARSRRRICLEGTTYGTEYAR